MARSRCGLSGPWARPERAVPTDSLEASRAAEGAARRSYGKLVAFLAARTRDVAGAEDALSEAFAAALTQWPERGVPDQPEGWLLTVARRRMVDAVRQRRQDETTADYFGLLEELAEPESVEASLPDRRLELLFACAHPGIEQAARAPLMLQTVLGFDAATIASAFLVAPATMGQRLVRAKAKIRQAGIGLQIPGRAHLAERLEAVLEAIYAAYAEGWSDAEGADPRRRNLAGEAIWLGRLVAALLPEQPEALGLLALMLHAQARRAARRDAQGEYVPLALQDTAQWDGAMIDEAEALLRRASQLRAPGRYQLEAAVQSAHCARRWTGGADWAAIVQLYEALQALTGSPVAALNRAVALAETQGVDAGLEALEALAGDVRLADYQPYWAARAELLTRSGARAQALDAYQHAIGLEREPAVRRFLQRRAAALSG
ncbi:MAG: RNA polymerase subunit sigma-70 [Burkholderiaceae bacterium]|nr:MAG: RNA polymerase subunit sigma-70 [Burkholderiaceae bacterium]TBR77050.1 MAG: RNA polymerase subunit sigma-70 [Burkholderiaceae bacterium]